MGDSSDFEAEDEDDFCLQAARARKESVRYGFETARSATEALTRSPARVRFGGASDSLHAAIDSEREASGSLTDSSITASGSTGPPPEKLAVDPHTSESGGRPPSVRRKFRTLTFGRRYKTKASAKENPKKRTRAPWNFKFKYRLKRCGLGFPASDIPELSSGGDTCVCTSYRRTEDHHLGAGVVFQADAAATSSAEAPSGDGKASRSKGRRLSQTATSGDPRSRCAAAGGQGSCGASDEHADDEERVHIIRRLESSESLVECVRITPGLLLWRASGSAAGGTGSASLTTGSASGGAGSASGGGRAPNLPAIDLSRFNPDEYPVEDWEERAFLERARELEEGVDPPPGYRPSSGCRLPVGNSGGGGDLASAFQHRLTVGAQYPPPLPPRDQGPLPQQAGGGGPWDPALSTETHLISQFARVTSQGAFIQRTVHTQVDYIHCLVPDLLEITSCTFYWGKMDRYEAEKLLENKPEGTFLLRDSAQEEYLFSVSFRRYSRSLHARIEQWNHKFSFDSHDPGVFASDTVCGLIEHYKDPSCCMFFEPMLTIPLHRTFTFPLQHLCRAVICRASSYDGVHQLALPKRLKAYLKEYHYKQRVRVRRFEMEQ